MKYLTWYILFGVIAVYYVIVTLFPFAGPIALSIHFIRVTASIATLIIFMRLMPLLFSQVPTPRRDYLIASINFFLASLVSFSIWNEAARVFEVDNNVFTSPIAGAFSVFAIIASVLALFAADTDGNKPKVIAIVIAAILSAGLVFVAPFFR